MQLADELEKETDMPNVLAFMNMKGGVGKTTLAVNVAHGIAKLHNRKTLLIDLDPQMNATEYCLSHEDLVDLLSGENIGSIFSALERRRGVIQMTMNQLFNASKKNRKETVEGIREVIDTLYLLPSHLRMWELDIRENKQVLLKLLEDIGEEYDYIILDVPPTLSPYTHAALLAADYYIVPIKLDVLSIWGLEFFQAWVNSTTPPSGTSVAELLGVAANMVQGRRLAEEYAEKDLIERGYGEALFETKVRNKADVHNALVSATDGKTLASRFLLNRKDDHLPGQIASLTREIIARVEARNREAVNA